MDAIPQIIVAALALLVVFLLGCTIGWLLRAKVFIAKPKQGAGKTGVVKSEETSKQTSVPEETSVDLSHGKPAALASARDGKKHDLKKITGIGPKLEDKLNALGIFHYDQIALWNMDEVDWVDDHLSFKGRIARDNWIEQARQLLET